MDFSIADCNMIIKSDSKTCGDFFKVIKFEMEHISGQPGYLGEYYYLNITYETVRHILVLTHVDPFC